MYITFTKVGGSPAAVNTDKIQFLEGNTTGGVKIHVEGTYVTVVGTLEQISKRIDGAQRGFVLLDVGVPKHTKMMAIPIADIKGVTEYGFGGDPSMPFCHISMKTEPSNLEVMMPLAKLLPLLNGFVP